MKQVRNLMLTAGLGRLLPCPAFACAACYGRSDDPLAHGINWGIFTLLGFVVLMLSSIATFFFIFLRRAAAANAQKLAEENLSGNKA